MGRSIHAGQVTVADGTDLAAQKLARVLTNDPGMGVIRHVDAGYEHATEIADQRGVRIPMRRTRDGVRHPLADDPGRRQAHLDRRLPALRLVGRRSDIA